MPAHDGLKKILFLLRGSYGVDFTYYKQTTIRRRVMRRVMLARLKQLEEYATYLQENKSEAEALYQDLLINVTSFFREPASLQALTQKIFPTLLKKREPTNPIKIWVAGCATGEEAYSLAIVLLEYLGNTSLTIPIQIFATDLNAKVVEKARLGIYPNSALAHVSPQRLSRFFTKIGGSYQVSKSIRDMCIFASHNFLKDPPFSRCDLISCQNVLIYFEPILQKKALAAFHYGLKPERFLLLGKAETVGESRELFAQIDKEHKFYTKKAGSIHLIDFAVKSQLDISQTTQVVEGGLEGQANEIDLEKEADTLLLSRYVPASVIINSDLEILQFRGETGDYLAPSSGRASLNLLKMVKDDLEFELRSVIYQAKKEKRPIQKEGLQIKVNGAMRTISLEVVPMKSKSTQFHFLILFKDTIKASLDSSQQTQRKGKRDPRDLRIAQLEQDQVQAQEQMKSLHEEDEAANEELQSANEEILSSNEELQSINEELETSKEELQSTNEELTTINDELQNRSVELRETRNYAEGIVETIREPLIVLNQDLRVRAANKAFYETFKVIPEETEGSLIYELGGNQWDIPLLRKLLDEILPQNNSFQDFEVTHTFPSIGHRVMLLNARRLVQEDSKKTMILLAIEDITEHKKAEHALLKTKEEAQAAKENFYSLFMHAPAIVAVLSGPELVFEMANPPYRQLVGKDRELDGKPLLVAIPDIEPSLLEIIKNVTTKGERFIGNELPILLDWDQNSKPYTKYLSLVYEPIFDENRKPNGLMCFGYDVSEQVTNRQKLEEAARSKDEFISIASHELKTPITTIKGYTDILTKLFQKTNQPQYLPYLSKMDYQINRLTSLINELLDVSRIQSGKLQLQKEDVLIDELIKDIIEDMQHTTDSHQIIFESNTNNHQILVDKYRLSQVLINLISNAIKYSPLSDKVIVKTSLSREYVTISIQDFGIGISKKDLTKIFDRFFQAKTHIRESAFGLGLGLYITSEIIKGHGGKIRAESFKGKSSIFSFTLPLNFTKKERKVTSLLRSKKQGVLFEA